MAFDHFRKTTQRERDIVQNAVLAGVQDLKLEASAVHTDVEQNLVLTGRIDRKTDDIVTGTNQIHRYLESRVAFFSRFSEAKNIMQPKKPRSSAITFWRGCRLLIFARSKEIHTTDTAMGLAIGS